MLRFVRSLILCSLVSASVFACGGSSGPDQIAFNSDRDGDWEIFVMDADGTNARQVTNNDVKDNRPAWSPNGRVLTFFREQKGEKAGPGLWTVDVTGYNERPLKTPGFASDPAWSPLIR